MTAVEFLVDKYNNCPKYHAVLTESDFTQAKEMEKEQQGYSEEDMKLAFENGIANVAINDFEFDIDTWFKQYKKK